MDKPFKSLTKQSVASPIKVRFQRMDKRTILLLWELHFFQCCWFIHFCTHIRTAWDSTNKILFKPLPANYYLGSSLIKHADQPSNLQLWFLLLPKKLYSPILFAYSIMICTLHKAVQLWRLCCAAARLKHEHSTRPGQAWGAEEPRSQGALRLLSAQLVLCKERGARPGSVPWCSLANSGAQVQNLAM